MAVDASHRSTPMVRWTLANSIPMAPGPRTISDLGISGGPRASKQVQISLPSGSIRGSAARPGASGDDYVLGPIGPRHEVTEREACQPLLSDRRGQIAIWSQAIPRWHGMLDLLYSPNAQLINRR